MKTKTVELVASPREPHFVGDGFRVHNFIPSGFRLDMQRMTPFILLDYNSTYNFPPSDKPKGVGVHPHRGFETVTIAYKGKVAHHDSSGGGGVIGEGDIQWMTAASGVLHKEYHEEEWSKKGGDFQMVQLWVNLPKKDKMSTPKYQAIKYGDINRYKLENGAGNIEVIAGEYRGIKGVASTFTPIHMLNAKLNKSGKAKFQFPANYNTALLVLEGNIVINGNEKAPTDHLALMANDGETFEIEATDDAIILVLSGEPINEPIEAHGPFVMNTKEELKEAFNDFNNGKFGFLED
ncbi:pirin family protein [Tamlana sp. 2_MG-2023]|uniref:pirin family protein n=1 Tax=unclassified Tamlana TaxID=2614803 RepID=UPI0026E42E12|nr:MULTISPECIES: pirin family protein [unclassified Tamlana]MDO6761188.1 pirin family protein [Tamlana sp. 2_MG-2023]MDO6791479.1 pirin family protein [Tamlana sp. 1_MG-2023]